MKVKGLLLILFLSSFQTITSQYIYFYDDNSLLAREDEISIGVVKEGKETVYIMQGGYKRLDMSKNMVTINLTSRTLQSTKTITVDMAKNDAAFYLIKFSKDNTWKIVSVEEEDASFSVKNDYKQIKEIRATKKRSKNHPKTTWTKNGLKAHFTTKSDTIEGIYKMPYKETNIPQITFGIVKNGNNFDVVYFSGDSEDVWSEGDIKARLYRTGKKGIFRLDWYNWDKTLEKKEVYARLNENALKIFFPNDTYWYFLKMYPVYK